jgi:hypothetical protein
MKTNDLKTLIHCLSNDPTRPILQHAYFDNENVWATDGHKLYNCKYKHAHKPFLMDVKGLKATVKTTKKNKDVIVDESLMIPANTHGTLPSYNLLIPKTHSMICEFTSKKSDELTFIVNDVEMPAIALKFVDDMLMINHGIGGRWLNDTSGIIATSDDKWCKSATTKHPVPVITYATRLHPPITHIWNQLVIIQNPNPICFVNSVTQSLYLIMPTTIRNGSNGFN